MELLQLKYFNETAKTNNFSHTAKKFMVPTSAVSQSIKRLEKELGIELFVRNSNKIQLSEAGSLFHTNIEKSLFELEKGVASVKKYSSTTKGTISILINTNRRFITDCIAEFKKFYTNVDFKIYHNLKDTDKANFNFIVSSDDMSINGYERTPIIKEEILLSIPKSNPLSNKNSVNFSEIINENFISMPYNSSLYNVLNKIFERNRATPNITIHCDDPFYVRKYTAMGLGISLFPSFSWKGLSDNNVVNLPFNDFSEQRTIYLYYEKNPNSDLKLLFKNFIVSEATKK